MTPSYRLMERVVMPAPMAVRVVDAATLAPIQDGLEVTAWSPLSPGQILTSTPPTPSGHYLFPAYPALEFAGDPIWAARPDLRPVIQVEDKQGRYLPFRFAAEPVRGVTTIPGSPPSRELTLFSSPARAPLNGIGTVRALLRDAATGRAGAWSLLDLTRDGITWSGLADQNGSVNIPVPYPEPAQFAVNSLSSGPTVALTNQQWSFQVRVRYRRWAPAEEIPAVPDLEEVQQMVAGVLFTDEAQTLPLTTALLRFGQELILRSRDASGRDLPWLLATP